jgi:nicotinamide mononucleotide (NMN) deamidase PncC
MIEEVVKILKKRKWCIGVMESCTGGAVANSLTNIPGVSDVFKSGLVTYSDVAKIKAGVDEKNIKKFGVYSIEVAKEMAIKIEGDIGVGVTGQFPGSVYIVVRFENKFVSEKIKVKSLIKNKIEARKEMKREVVGMIWEMVIAEI